MNFQPSSDHVAVIEGVSRVCQAFDDKYWLARDSDGEFPFDFHAAMAEGGWLGITMPEQYGGSGLGVTEAALMMKTVAASGGALAAASAIHINLFGPHPIVVHGSEEQKQRWLPRLISGDDKTCFGVCRYDFVGVTIIHRWWIRQFALVAKPFRYCRFVTLDYWLTSTFYWANSWII